MLAHGWFYPARLRRGARARSLSCVSVGAVGIVAELVVDADEVGVIEVGSAC